MECAKLESAFVSQVSLAVIVTQGTTTHSALKNAMEGVHVMLGDVFASPDLKACHVPKLSHVQRVARDMAHVSMATAFVHLLGEEMIATHF